MQPISVRNFEPKLEHLLPQTYALLMAANLVVHPSVSRVVLHGSRGLARKFRPESDVDLSLIVNIEQADHFEAWLRNVVKTTMDQWQSKIELDLAVIFDRKNCDLKCFQQTAWNSDFCRIGGVDCFGLFKTQKGFNGLVTNAGIQVRLMYPCLEIWHRQ